MLASCMEHNRHILNHGLNLSMSRMSPLARSAGGCPGGAKERETAREEVGCGGAVAVAAQPSSEGRDDGDERGAGVAGDGQRR